ncbi:MAG: sensor domain-containing diguanylate cyclase, partial [Candidatus Woesearchaeota archaeon]
MKDNIYQKETYQSFINALPYSAAILDKKGVILCVNEKWKEFGMKNNLSMKDQGKGANYIKIAEEAVGKDADLANKAAKNIKKIISGKKDIFFMEYPCHSEEEKRWFKMKVKPFENGVLVIHENITKIKKEKKWNKALFENSNSAIARLDDKHNIMDINDNFTEKFGYELNEIKGKNLDDILEKGKQKSVNKNMTQEVLGGSKVKAEGTRYLKTGEAREFLIKGIPITIDGEVEGIYAIYEDITELKRQEEKLDSIFNSSLDIGYVIAEPINEGKDAVIREVSPGARNIFGFDLGKSSSEKNIVGESINNYFSEDMISKMPMIHRAVKRGETINRQTKLIDKEGKTAYVMANISLFMAGEKNKVISVFMNISELEKAKKKLQKNRKNLKATLNSIGDAVIATDENGYITQMNPVAKNLTGYSFKEAKGLPLKDIFNIVNANTRKVVKNPAREVLEKGKKVGLANHTLLISKNGEEYQIADSAAPIRDDKGEIRGVVLVFRDVTEEYHMRKQIREQRNFLSSILETQSGLVVVINKEGEIIKFNKASEKLTGYSLEEVQGENLFDIFIKENEKEEVKQVFKKLTNKNYPIKFENYWLTKKGKEKLISWSNNVILNEKNEIKYIVGTGIDITERKKREKRIRYISHHDSITDLYNRTYMEKEIKKIDANYKLPVGIIMIDINGLRIINEAYGHKKGDEILMKTAEILRSCIQDEDLVARWAGDEFIILLTQTSKKQTKNIVEIIRKKAKTTQLQNIPISFGLGYALKNNSEQDIYEVLYKAEDKVYKDKLTKNMSMKNKLVQNMLNTLGAKSDETKEHAQRMTKLSYN